ncbi:hypothetical protein G6L46_10950 [Agrobacterium rhizogenes]|uniref:hypothetical protein n=1 Tax=Rhizobium rhizogenes TaxID=359 RepID=UPI001574A2E7|nr:hypothetical protein [Rhizobium rhizogenes]NTF87642.1 hypothetical protein [Rhizobium rhizogenes]
MLGETRNSQAWACSRGIDELDEIVKVIIGIECLKGDGIIDDIPTAYGKPACSNRLISMMEDGSPGMPWLPRGMKPALEMLSQASIKQETTDLFRVHSPFEI